MAGVLSLGSQHCVVGKSAVFPGVFVCRARMRGARDEGVTRLSCEHVANRRLKTGASLKGWRRLKDVRKWSPGADLGYTWKNANNSVARYRVEVELFNVIHLEKSLLTLVKV